MRCIVGLLLVAGCGRVGFGQAHDASGMGDGDGGGDGDGEVAAFTPTWISGSRIRARVLRAVEGGDPRFAGWHDSLLDTDCQSAPAADGIERCLPTAVIGNRFFADAACTQQPLALAYSAVCGNDRFASTRDGLQQLHVFSIGPSYTGPSYDNNAGTCLPSGPPSNATLYSLGTELAPAQFIAAHYEHRMDGSYMRLWAGFTDGATSDLRVLEDGNGTCKPNYGRLGPTQCGDTNRVSARAVYRDAACTQRAYLAIGAPATTPRLAVPSTTLCGRVDDLVSPTGDVTAAQYYESTTAGCIQSTTPGGGTLFTATPLADPFPTGVVAPGPRRGRLGELYWTATDGRVVDLFTYDHDLGLPCRQFRASDGVLRCLPDEPTRVVASADGTCTAVPAALVAGCWGHPPLAGPNYPSCTDQGYAVRPYAAVGPQASVHDETSCRTLDPPAPGVFDANALGAEVAPATFAQLVETVE